MTAAWESPVLSRVNSEARDLAEDVAAELGMLPSPAIEVVRLHLEALDSALGTDAPELLADQLRWQHVRLESAGVTAGPADVAIAVRTVLARKLDESDLAEVVDIQNAAAVLGESGAFVDGLVELEGPALDYLRATLQGRRDEAIGIIRDALLEDMEQAGWRTAYLGADLPHADVIEQVALHRADVLALSATMAGHIRGVRDLIRALRGDPRGRGVRVLVGGRPFTINPRLADEVGADGWAPGAREAVELCCSWGEERVGAG